MKIKWPIQEVIECYNKGISNALRIFFLMKKAYSYGYVPDFTSYKVAKKLNISYKTFSSHLSQLTEHNFVRIAENGCLYFKKKKFHIVYSFDLSFNHNNSQKGSWHSQIQAKIIEFSLSRQLYKSKKEGGRLKETRILRMKLERNIPLTKKERALYKKGSRQTNLAPIASTNSSLFTSQAVLNSSRTSIGNRKLGSLLQLSSSYSKQIQGRLNKTGLISSFKNYSVYDSSIKWTKFLFYKSPFKDIPGVFVGNGVLCKRESNIIIPSYNFSQYTLSGMESVLKDRIQYHP